MFKKKFKVRVRHFCGGYYCVEYAHYRLVPIWRSIYYWFEQSYTSNTESWSTKLFSSAEAAEKFAEKLTLESLAAYIKSQEEKSKVFYRGQQEYYRKHVPYDCKAIAK